MVESINFSSIQGGKILVKVGMKEPLAALPQSFAVTNPARIAIDLPDTTSGLGKTQVEAGEGDLKSVSVVQTANRTRLVMNLARSLTYTAALDGKLLVVTIDGSQASATATPSATERPGQAAMASMFAEAPPGAVRQNIRDVDFRRGNAGEGRVIVDLSSANTGIDIRQQGRSILIDFINSSVPKNLVRRLDVGDFGTPVRFVDTFEQGGNARMVIEPRGIWEYSAYQTDTQFILEVKPVKEDPNKLVQSSTPGYAGEKLSLNFQNVEVRAVLQVIADFTGLNIITSDTVGGNLTLRLKDVPWDQALDIILQSKGLSKRKNGNVVLIAPDRRARRQGEARARGQRPDLRPGAAAHRVLRALLREGRRPQEAAVRQGPEDPLQARQRDRRRAHQHAVRAGHRRPPRGGPPPDPAARRPGAPGDDRGAHRDRRRQVGPPAGRALRHPVGLRLRQPQLRRLRHPDRHGLAAVQQPALARFRRTSRTRATRRRLDRGPQGNVPAGGQPEQLNVNLPVVGAAGSLALSILNLGSGNLVNIELSALEADNRGKVVSSPRVITADKKKAVISQGTEIPYQTAAASGATTIAFKPAVLELAVTPRITPDDRIIMDLEVKKDSVGQIFANIPSIDTKKVTTQVLCDNGDTIVLGGIFEQTTRTTVEKVPFLGDIPVVGYLFKRTVKQDDKTELLIFVTPKIVKETLTVR